MTHLHSRFSLWVLAASATATHAIAQTEPTQLETVTVVSKRTTPPVAVTGWGTFPLNQTPLQASVFTAEQLQDQGAQRLSDLVGWDPALSDAYNSEGYVDYLTVRGFVINNRFNYRRDGLPINAETSIALDNKERIEVLKGTSGLQAGTSAPGGLVNYVVKRPLEATLRSATLGWREAGNMTAAVDLSQRFGPHQALGARLNVALAHLEPTVKAARGERQLYALAADWRLNDTTLLEAEIESSRQSQPSVPGFSLLGNRVPEPGDARTNLNNQPWSLPVVFDGTTASLRWQQQLSPDWRWVAHAATQQLRTDDRVAFPFGCTDTNGTYYADRYCPSGNFDLYDFRSENERRRTHALDLSVQGTLQTGSLHHTTSVGVLRSTVRNQFQRQAFNLTGAGNVNGLLVAPASPALTDENTNRQEKTTELYLKDTIALTPQWRAWLGLRHTQLERRSVRTDGSRPTDYTQSFTTPSLAISYAWAPEQLLYASVGQGVESEVVPNRARYTNPGLALPALKSRQIELGLKGASTQAEWSVAGFHIQQPQFADIGTCDLANTCTRQVQGKQTHQGFEANTALRTGTWTLRAGTQWLHARLDNGLQPTNVPKLTLKLQAEHRVPQLPGLSLQANANHQSRRMALPDNTARIAGYMLVNTSARFQTQAGQERWTWRAGIDNLLNRQGWKESPYQFGHAYLFGLAPRTVRLSVEVTSRP
jgi:iron complex outermembrane recepter protein